MDASWGIRAQPHIDFMNTVRSLSIDKITAVWQIGFGPLQSIGCPRLYDKVCKLMIDNLEPLNERVVIHGRSFTLCAYDFERIMGVRDGGLDMEFSTDSHTSTVVSHMKQHLVGLDGNITQSSLKEFVLRRAGVDQIFQVAYVLYAVSALLCPTNNEVVDSVLLTAIVNSNAIGDLNWATYCFRWMMDIILIRSGDDNYSSGACLYFLQVFYFQTIGENFAWVDSTITPVIYWGLDKVESLVQFVSQNGGISSENFRVWEHELGCTWMPVEETCSGDLWRLIHDMREKVDHCELTQKQLVETLQGVKTSIEDMSCMRSKHVNVLASEIVKVYKSELDSVFARATRTEMTDVRSNSVQKNGGKNFETKGRNSHDSSCMYLYSNNVNDEMIDNDQIKVNGKKGKEPETTLSDCSVSPKDQKSLRKRTAQKNSKVPTSFVHVLFKPSTKKSPMKKKSQVKGRQKVTIRNDETVDAGPFRVNRSTSKDDIDLLKFIFMPMDNKSDVENDVDVVSVGGQSITRTDLQCLGPGELVCSIVTNAFVKYLNKIGKEIWYVPTLFGRFSVKKSEKESHDEWIDRSKRLSRLDRFIGHFTMCRMIFIPIHEPAYIKEGIAHWYLLAVHIIDRFVQILDSFPDPAKRTSQQSDAQAVLTMLDRLYGDTFRRANPLFSFNILPFKDVTGPRQRNCTDCGVFVIRNMQRYGTNWAAKYDSDIERASLVLKCLKNPKNEVGDLHAIVDRSLARITNK